MKELVKMKELKNSFENIVTYLFIVFTVERNNLDLFPQTELNVD